MQLTLLGWQMTKNPTKSTLVKRHTSYNVYHGRFVKSLFSTKTISPSPDRGHSPIALHSIQPKLTSALERFFRLCVSHSTPARTGSQSPDQCQGQTRLLLTFARPCQTVICGVLRLATALRTDILPADNRTLSPFQLSLNRNIAHLTAWGASLPVIKRVFNLCVVETLFNTCEHLVHSNSHIKQDSQFKRAAVKNSQPANTAALLSLILAAGLGLAP